MNKLHAHNVSIRLKTTTKMQYEDKLLWLKSWKYVRCSLRFAFSVSSIRWVDKQSLMMMMIHVHFTLSHRIKSKKCNKIKQSEWESNAILKPHAQHNMQHQMYVPRPCRAITILVASSTIHDIPYKLYMHFSEPSFVLSLFLCVHGVSISCSRDQSSVYRLLDSIFSLHSPHNVFSFFYWWLLFHVLLLALCFALFFSLLLLLNLLFIFRV